MRIGQFVQKYTLHDSLVKQIQYDPDHKKLSFLVDLCWWAQDEYDESRSLPEIVWIVFHNVPEYSGIQGMIDNYSVLRLDADGKRIALMILDDFRDTPYVLPFQADSVTMEACPAAQ